MSKMDVNYEVKLLKEIDTLTRIVKRYDSIIDEQSKTINKLKARNLELTETWEPPYDREAMIKKLEEAQLLLSDVYHDATEAGLSNVENLMSAADSCIGEALGDLEGSGLEGINEADDFHLR